MVEVYILPEAFGLPSASPYCMKLIIWLEMAGVAYAARPADLRQSPNKKVPYVDFDGERIAESDRIIECISDATGKSLEPPGDPRTAGLAHAAKRIAEDSFYWSTLYSRWWDPNGWTHFKPVVQTILPPVLRPVLVNVVRNSIKKSLYIQGLGRLPPEEIDARTAADLDALCEILGARPFFAGEAPSAEDVAVFAQLLCALASPWECAPKVAIEAHTSLMAYVDRMKSQWPGAS